MSVTNLDLSNVINVTLLGTPQGLNVNNVNTLAIFTDEQPLSPFSAGFKIYNDPSSVAVDYGSSSQTFAMALAAFSQNPNFLGTGGYLACVPMLQTPSAETLEAAIVRVQEKVYFCGIVVQRTLDATAYDAATDAIQALDKLFFYASADVASIASGTGMFDIARLASKTHARQLLYTVSATEAQKMSAAYAARALSVNFSGSLTASTMHLKSLASITVDSGVSQTVLVEAGAAGADVYASISGIPCVFCSGANTFFDEVYNELWFKFALQTAGFNYLRQTNTKVPQTESGIAGLKAAYQQVCAQAVSNGFLAPGSWTSATTVGRPEDLARNISDAGYYIYSLPIAQQTVADRTARKAPVIQIAAKSAGAVHRSDVIVNINI